MEKHEKLASFQCRGRKNLGIYFWYSMPVLKHDQKRFIRFPSLNVPEMRPLGTFQSIFSGSCHFDFSFGYVFPSSTTVQSFITIKLQAKKLSMIKVFTFFVSGHLNWKLTLIRQGLKLAFLKCIRPEIII